MTPTLFINFFTIVLVITGQFFSILHPTLPAATQASAQHIQVPAQMDLQTAINQIANGGVIDMAAGTYASPVDAFKIDDLGKGFTIRGNPGATVVIDGGNARPLVRFINSSLGAAGPVQFQNLTFTRGYSNSAGTAAGVTIMNANATFIDTRFTNNSVGAGGTGGATSISNNSTALFINTLWQNNTAVNYGAGLVVAAHAKVYIHNSQFLNNRANPPGHSQVAAGGAIHVGNSILRVSNTRFEGNQAGYVGGGLYAIGTFGDAWTTDVVIANCTFINNMAINDPSVSLNVPTEGGAVHIEAQAMGHIYNSRFITNFANAGGGVNLYRANVDIENSSFLGNWVTANAAGQGGCGGAIGAGSNDTAVDGSSNYASAYVTIQNSYFQGQYGTTTTTANNCGGAIMIGGDVNRVYGFGGVSKMGTLANNRGKLYINTSAFVNFSAQKAYGGMGGAIFSDLGDVALQNSLVLGSVAGGTNGSGGGVSAIDQSLVTLTNTTFAKNNATMFGGAIHSSGSELEISASDLIENSVNTSFGSAIFATTDDANKINQTGTVQNSTISNNTGPSAVTIFDDDRNSATLPINALVYNNNKLYPDSTSIYGDALVGGKTVSQLNPLVINRSSSSTTKSPAHNNQAASSKPIVGAVLAVPLILPCGAAGDAPGPLPAYFALAWSGGSATLDGSSVSGNIGAAPIFSTMTHTLAVAGTNFSTNALLAANPAAIFSESGRGPSYTLSWNVNGGTFLDAFIDHGVTIPTAGSGSVGITPPTADGTYYFYAITKEGGVLKSTNQLHQYSVPYFKN